MRELAEDPRSASLRRMTFIALGTFFAVLLAASLALWAKLGTVVFFETVRAGIAYCF
ncbi:MAG: hypothetical protein Q7S17_02535 [Xanthobacteraceae bacterium]|nr:hypothetical protein [Xanthobacteraceae bacterium]